MVNSTQLKEGASLSYKMAFQLVGEVGNALMMVFPLVGEMVGNAPTLLFQLAGEVMGNISIMIVQLAGEVVGNAPMIAFQLDGVGKVVLGHVHAPENCVLMPSGMIQWPS